MFQFYQPSVDVINGELQSQVAINSLLLTCLFVCGSTYSKYFLRDQYLKNFEFDVNKFLNVDFCFHLKSHSIISVVSDYFLVKTMHMFSAKGSSTLRSGGFCYRLKDTDRYCNYLGTYHRDYTQNE